MTWNEPTTEKCPECGSTLFKKGGKNGILLCEKEGCGYSRALGAEKKGVRACTSGSWARASRDARPRCISRAAATPWNCGSKSRINFPPRIKNADFAELVCSNSLKADRLDSASGLLKAEMKLLGSALLPVAEGCRVAAGGALAVDREAFAAGVTALVKGNPNITLRTGEAQAVGEAEPDTLVLTATGPLTEGALAQDIARLTGRGALVLRRRRAHRHGGQHRPGQGVRGVALRARHGGLPQLPVRQSGLRGLPCRAGGGGTRAPARF